MNAARVTAPNTNPVCRNAALHSAPRRFAGRHGRGADSAGAEESVDTPQIKRYIASSLDVCVAWPARRRAEFCAMSGGAGRCDEQSCWRFSDFRVRESGSGCLR
jgi:hypothetical protein